MYGLVVGSQFVANGLARNALIVGCEVMSRTVDPKDKKTYPLFGDGAGAALLQPVAASDSQNAENAQGILAFTPGAEGSPEAHCPPCLAYTSDAADEQRGGEYGGTETDKSQNQRT